VTSPLTTPHRSSTTLATGARQLVVQEALETMACRAGSYVSSLTPMQTVRSAPRAGAVMITFFAPPARCALALAASVKKPVASITMSTPRAPHGSLAGSRSARICSSCPSMARPRAVRAIAPSPPANGP